MHKAFKRVIKSLEKQGFSVAQYKGINTVRIFPDYYQNEFDGVSLEFKTLDNGIEFIANTCWLDNDSIIYSKIESLFKGKIFKL